jgi:hypothetical protein
MAEEKEAFLARWSRLKREQPAEAEAQQSTPAKAESEKPLPPVETLTPESDFSAFMQPKVSEALRRSALKKLFRDPQFNVPDLFEPYSRDWTVGDPIPPDLLAQLNQARTVLLTPEERKALEEQEQAPQAEEKQEKDAPADEPGRQDT